MILVSVIITCQMIWMRFVLNESTIWQTEAVTYLMISATLIGLPYVQLLRGHVNVDLVPMLLPPRMRKALALLVLVLSIAVISIMAFHGYELFHEAWRRNWRSESVWGVEHVDTLPGVAAGAGAVRHADDRRSDRGLAV